MKTEVEVISINGMEYVKKSDVVVKELDNDYFIVRTYSAGVFAGEIVERNGKEVLMKNARRIWYWDGAASLSQLSIDGTSKPENCQFPEEMAEVTLTEVIEIIKCTKKARASIAGVKIWKK